MSSLIFHLLWGRWGLTLPCSHTSPASTGAARPHGSVLGMGFAAVRVSWCPPRHGRGSAPFPGPPGQLWPIRFGWLFEAHEQEGEVGSSLAQHGTAQPNSWGGRDAAGMRQAW